MKKRFTLGTVLALMLPVAVLAVIIAYSIVRSELITGFEFTEAQRKEYAKYIEARNNIMRYYVGPVDDDELLDGAIRGMVSTLRDQYSHYLNPDEYEAFKNNSDSQFGIGVTVGMSDDGDILINEVYENSPAQERGVERLDRIVAIEGRPVSEMGYHLAVSALTGEENTRVNVTLLKASTDMISEISLVRRKTEVKAVYSEILAGQNIGLIHIRNFDQSVDLDFREVLTRLQNASVDAIIFDVRNNPGGQLDIMCHMLDMLLPKESLLITLRDRNGQEFPRSAESADHLDLPMVVLINNNSYSAAEFFAAALWEYDKAFLVGDPTTGKGYAQTTYQMSDGSALVLSTREYFTPKGVSLSGVGLTPDYAVSLSEDASKNFYSLPHEQDAQLQKAIEVLLPLLPVEFLEPDEPDEPDETS